MKKKILRLLNKSKYLIGLSIVNEVLLIKMLSKDITEIRFFLNDLLEIFDCNFNIPRIWSL